MTLSYQMNDEFISLLEKLKFEKPQLFAVGIDIYKSYGVSRSLRRGANSKAKEEGVSEDLRTYINRWSSYEAKKGSRPNMSMSQHYVETQLILKRILVYSKSL